MFITGMRGVLVIFWLTMHSTGALTLKGREVYCGAVEETCSQRGGQEAERCEGEIQGEVGGRRMLPGHARSTNLFPPSPAPNIHEPHDSQHLPKALHMSARALGPSRSKPERVGEVIQPSLCAHLHRTEKSSQS